MSYAATGSVDSPHELAGVQDWAAGALQLRPSDSLPNGYYRRLINGEIRRGYPETRRGTRKLAWMMNEGEPIGATYQAVQWFRPSRPGRTQPPDMVLAIVDNDLWVCRPNNPPKVIQRDITDDAQPCTIIPAHNVALILRGLGQTPLIYDPYNQLYRGGGVLSLPTPPAGSGRVVLPAADTGCSAAGRIWLKTGFDEVIASDIFEFDYTTTNVFRIDSGTNGEIVRLWPYGEDSLLVFKTDGVFRLRNINDVSNLARDRVYAAAGCVAADSIAQVGSDLFYLSANGVERLTVSDAGIVVQAAEQFCAPIADTFKGMVWPAASGARGMIVDDYYVISVPSKATWRQVDALAREWGDESDFAQPQDLPGNSWTPTTPTGSGGTWFTSSQDYTTSGTDSYSTSGWTSTSSLS